MVAGGGVDQRVIHNLAKWRCFRISPHFGQPGFNPVKRQGGIGGMFVGKPAAILGVSLVIGTVLMDVLFQRN